MKSPLNKLLYLLLFSFIFRSDFTYAQNYNPLQWITITKEDGLAGDSVYSILKDRQGNLWFGTNNGVSRYDGKAFTNFTTVHGLAGNGVNSILEDRKGNLWFGTNNGVSVYDGKSFTNFTTANGLTGNNISSILEDRQGNLWFGTSPPFPKVFGGGVSRYDGRSFNTLTMDHDLPYNPILSILEDRYGNLWFGTSEGVSRYDGKSFTNFSTAHGLAGNYVESILEDRQGNLWFCTRGGVSRYDGKSFINFNATYGLAGDFVYSIMEDHQGNIWFGSGIYILDRNRFFFKGGVSRYDGKIFTTFTTANGLIGNLVYSILEDYQGNLWFGTDEGVSRYDFNSFNNFLSGHGIAGRSIWSIQEDHNGDIWFGTDEGVSRYHDKSFANFTTVNGLAEGFVLSIQEDRKGNLWFGTSEGVSRYNGKSFTNFTTDDGLAGKFVSTILEDRQGNLWFGTDGGVSRHNCKSFTNFITVQGFEGNSVRSILEDRQSNLWFGSFHFVDGGKDFKGNGVCFYDRQSFTNLTTAHGLAGNEVYSILEDHQGNLWFGTNNGISRYDGKSFTNFNKAHGLSGNRIHSILEDSQSNLWFGTIDGVSRYDGRTFTIFTTAHGLSDDYVQAILEDHQGNLWFGTYNGVSKCGFTKKTPAIAHVKEISVGLFFILVRFDGFSYNTSADELKFTSRFDNESWGKPQKRKWQLKSYLLGVGRHTFLIRAYDQYKNFPPIIEKTFTITKLEWLLNISLYGLILFSPIVLAAVRAIKIAKRRNVLKRKFNPYIAGPPIINSNMFYGREELIHAIINTVSQNNIAIRAERRMGKTSILHQLEKRLTRPYSPILINIQGIKEAEFFSRLTERIIRTCKKYFKNSIDLIFEKNSMKYDDIDFISDLDIITTHLKETFSQDVILVLLIDEIDELVGYDIQISKRFRAIFTEGKLPVRAVVAGTFFDQQKWDDKTSPWYNFFVIHRLESLTEPEARSLITKPSKGIYSFDKDAIERILTLSGKQPYLIQTICHYAINKILAEKRRKVTTADIEAVYHSNIEEKEKS